jgi:hypothetical protein
LNYNESSGNPKKEARLSMIKIVGYKQHLVITISLLILFSVLSILRAFSASTSPQSVANAGSQNAVAIKVCLEDDE